MPPGRSVELILASASPRRRELLRSIGVEFSVRPADVDETPRRGEDPVAYVERIATSKALAVAGALGPERSRTAVLAADTTVDLAGEILAKPVDDADARRMLRGLAGGAHRVHTAVVGWRDGDLRRATVTTEVVFAELTDADIEWYVALGEHLDKAGAYAMQGAAGAFVQRIVGSPSNVIGLPLVETIGILRACEVVGQLRRPVRT